jgi:hypothetical protein
MLRRMFGRMPLKALERMLGRMLGGAFRKLSRGGFGRVFGGVPLET